MALQPWHSWIPSIKRSLFFLSGFSFTDTDDSLDSKGRAGNHLLFQSTSTSTRSRTLKHLFATLHLRWLLRIFNRNACVYQTVLDGIYHIIELPFEWLIDWWCNVFLFTWWIDSRFLLQRFDMRNRWIWTWINYHSCFTSESTNLVSYQQFAVEIL